jgi:signal transduction histidine kinase
LQGGILIGARADVSFRSDETEALVALAAIASAALERGLLLDALGRQVDEMRMLHALGDVLAGRMDAGTLVARLDRLLRKRGYQVAGISFKSGNLHRRLRGAIPDEWDRAAWSDRRLVEAGDGTLRIPMVVGRRAIGSMRLRTKRHRADHPFLQALAGGVGEIALRAALRSELEESEREVALTTERGRIAAELSDTIGQTFVGLALGIDRAARGLDDGSPARATLQELAGEARRGAVEVERVSRSMATFPEARLGIVPALVALAESFEDDGGPVLLVDVRGPSRFLPPMVERILYRSAHEILSLATRHSRCSVLRLEIVFEPDAVSMIVDDDGTGASSRGHELPYRTGLLAARRSLQEAGGALRLTSRRPHGSRIVVSVPAAAQ